MWDNIKKCIYVVGMVEGKQTDNGAKEILAKNIPKFMIDTEPQIHTSSTENTKQDKFQNIYIKADHIQTSKTKNRENLEKKIEGVKQNKKLTYRRTRKRITADSPQENKQAKREWNEIFKILKEKCHNLEFYI